MYACNCLNVIIETNDFEKVKVDSLQLGDDVHRDTFFEQELQLIQKLPKVTNKISGLISTRNVGLYTIYHCFNCNVNTHAIRNDNASTFVLVSSQLLDKAAISMAKASVEYSLIYDIKISTDVKSQLSTFNNMAPEEKVLVNSLMQKANESINHEMAAVEDRIRKFSDQQHAIFEEYKSKVLLEYEAISRKILESKRRASKEITLSTKTLSSDSLSIRSPVRTNVPEQIASPTRANLLDRTKANNNISSLQALTPHRSNLSSSRPASFDSEGLFLLEDMEDEFNYEMSDHDESDNELSAHHSREAAAERQRNSMQMAKSLPVSIPVLSFRSRGYDEDDRLPEESMDIAASIKALAKSIQGDTIFGDLPARPRFSSQI